MAGVVKWLRPRIVVPIYMGSNPIIRPTKEQIAAAICSLVLVLSRMRTHHRRSQSVVRARGGRGRRLDDKMAKPLKSATVDPFNAAEQDNPIIRPTFRI